MKCPQCSTLETKVVDSRMNQQGDMIRRRRRCPLCEFRFTTYERLEESLPAVIKKDGRRETFNREKILLGLQKACQKRNVPTEVIDGLIHRIEKRVQSFGVKEIPAKTIGQMVMAGLREIDKVAYVRFASVYRDFQDVDEFIGELRDDVNLESVNDDTLAFPFVMESAETAESLESSETPTP